MKTTRLEAFSDAVIAIILTIMVLELKVPHSIELSALTALLPVFFSYILSFIYVGIYWNNHHHLFHAARKTDGRILWANMHLMFWLSLIPFVTGWMGENHFSAIPTMLYGIVLLMCAIAYWILQRTILHSDGADSPLRTALGKDIKGKISPLLYLAGILTSLYSPLLSQSIYAAVALMWLIPDSRIERTLAHQD